jgi:MFS family permease
MDHMSTEKDRAFARKGRITGLVIAAGGLAAILAPWIVQVLALPARYEMLIYFASIAAFIWALVNVLQLWRMRQDSQR